MRDYFAGWNPPNTAITDAEYAYYGPGIFVTIIRERARESLRSVTEEFIKKKVTRLMKYERDSLVLRDTCGSKKARPVSEIDKNWLQYTLDPKCDDETPEEQKEDYGPIELLLYLLRQNFDTHSLIDKWAMKDKWESLRKKPTETHEHFFLRYEDLKMQLWLHGVELGPESDRARHLFNALGLDEHGIARLLETTQWDFPETEAQVDQIIANIKKKCYITEGGNRHLLTKKPPEYQRTRYQNRVHWTDNYKDLGGFVGMNQLENGPMQSDTFSQHSAGDATYEPLDIAPCQWCNDHEAYFLEDPEAPFDTDTDDDFDIADDHVYHQWIQQAHAAQWSDDVIANILAYNYYQAKSRFRKFFKKKPRRFRVFKRRTRTPAKGGKGQYHVLCTTCMSWDDEHDAYDIEATVHFQQKGKGKSKGKGGEQGRKNPVKNGKHLTCFHCGSEYHLAASCPRKGPSPGGGPHRQHHQNSPPRVAQQHAQQAAASAQPRAPAPNAPQPQLNPYGPAFTPNGPSFTNSWIGLVTHSESKPEVEIQLAPSKHNIRDPTTKRTSRVKHASTETPSQVNLAEAWIKAMEDGTKVGGTTTVKKIMVVRHSSYPVRASDESSPHEVWETRMENGDEGILIDTGAAINCVGEMFCQRFNDLMKAKGAPPAERVKFERLPNAHYISGLGKGTTKTNTAADIPCHALGLGAGLTHFKGAYLPKQSSPAILGMVSLKSLNAIIDCRNGKQTMYVSPSGHDFEIEQKGEDGRGLPLVCAPSGHLMLPISVYESYFATECGYEVETEVGSDESGDEIDIHMFR